jgi:hypothetical protein
MSEKQAFKKKILDWLAENNIHPEKVRVYDTRRYGLEVRVYHAPMVYISSRISFRETHRDDTQRYGTRGHHTIKIPLYTAINEEALATKEERKFTLRCLRDNL